MLLWREAFHLQFLSLHHDTIVEEKEIICRFKAQTTFQGDRPLIAKFSSHLAFRDHLISGSASQLSFFLSRLAFLHKHSLSHWSGFPQWPTVVQSNADYHAFVNQVVKESWEVSPFLNSLVFNIVQLSFLSGISVQNLAGRILPENNLSSVRMEGTEGIIQLLPRKSSCFQSHFLLLLLSTLPSSFEVDMWHNLLSTNLIFYFFQFLSILRMIALHL